MTHKIELLDCPMKERFLNYALPSNLYSCSDGRVFLTPNGIEIHSKSKVEKKRRARTAHDGEKE